VTIRRDALVERTLPAVGALACIAVGTAWAVSRVGYPETSGIVEESVGGPGVAAIVTAVAGAPVALGVGLLDGLIGAVRNRAVRAAVRVLLYGVLGAWCALMVALVAEIDCDGTCLAADSRVVGGGAGAEIALVVVTYGVARGVDRLRSVVSSTRIERSGRETTA